LWGEAQRAFEAGELRLTCGLCAIYADKARSTSSDIATVRMLRIDALTFPVTTRADSAAVARAG